MDRKKARKLIFGVSVAVAVAMIIPLISGCAAPGPTPEPTPTPQPGEPTPEPTPTPTPEPAEELPTWHLRMPTVASASDYMQHAGEFVQDIETMTGGRITIDLYSSCELIPDDQVMNAVKSGAADCSMYMCYCNPALTDTGWVEGNLPYGIDNPVEWEVLYHHRGLEEIFKADYDEFGVTYVGPWQYDPSSTMISTKPIEELADFQGLKLSSFPPMGGVWADAGATMVNVPPDELYLAGKTGVVDAVGWGGAHQYFVMQLAEAYPYYLSNSCAGSLVGCFIINTELWESFGPEIQAMFDCAVEKASIHDSTFKYDGESWGREPFTVTTLSEDDEYELMKFAWEYWDAQAELSDRAAQVVQIYKDYNSELEACKWHRSGRELPWE